MSAIANPNVSGGYRHDTPTPANDDAIIDLFAGGGGASTGIEWATGRSPDIAVNHSEDATNLHKTNHPTTHHVCTDIRGVNVVRLVQDRLPGRLVGLLWASPDCRHHSKASGGALKDRGIRGLAWEVLRWIAGIKRATGRPPGTIILENVEEFQDWCPVHRYGKKAGRAMRKRKGETFRLWCEQLRALGGDLQYRELVAANYGAPTTRKRLFVVIQFWGQPVAWPEHTHGPVHGKGGERDLFSALEPTVEPYRTAANSVIDWSIKPPSIFTRRKPLVAKTRARIAKGFKRYVIEAPRPFLVPLTHAGERSIKTVDEALPTITAAHRGELALAGPTIVPVDNGTWNPDRIWDAQEPLRTVKASKGGDYAMSAAFLQKMAENGVGYRPDEPIHTAMAGAPRHYMATAFLTPSYGEREGQEPRSLPIDAPAPTTVPGGNGGRLTTAFLARQFGTAIGMPVDTPHPTVMTDGAGGKSQLVSPIIDKYYATGVAQSADEPLDTATTKARFGLSAVFLEQANTGVVGHDAREPVSTIIGAGSTQRLVDAVLGDANDDGPQRADVLRFLWEHFGEPTEAEIADPLATAAGRLKFGLVIIDGIVWQITDIGMRMLTPRELYRAQGFPDTYQIEVTWEGKALTKTAQTRGAGNSVPPQFAEALVRSNCARMCVPQRLAA